MCELHVRRDNMLNIHPKVSDVLKMPRIASQTAERFKFRQRTESGNCRLTASDLASVLGMNPYCSRLQLFKRKTHQVAPSQSCAATEWGQRFENEAAEVYQRITGNELISSKDLGDENAHDIGLLIHKNFPQFGGSQDRLLKYRPILVEIKCPR